MNKFKAGDIVRVRGWDDMEAEFGLNPSGHIACEFTFLERMKYLCSRLCLRPERRDSVPF